MENAVKGKFVAGTLMPMLLACTVPSLLTACAPIPAQTKAPPSKPAADMFRDKNAYLEQNFSPSVLPEEVQKAVEAADSRSVPFARITVTSKLKSFSNASSTPVDYVNQSVYENAGNGLVRMMVTVQSNGFDVSTDFSLSYRAYVGLMTQNVLSTAYSLPPVTEVRSVDHFDPVMSSDTMNYSLHSGYVGNSRISSPFQLHCQAGRSYAATVIHQNIQGTVREMDCQLTNSNGVVTQIRKYAYLEHYGIAITLHSKTPANEQNVEITDFKAE
jgi:hypothetical protein